METQEEHLRKLETILALMPSGGSAMYSMDDRALLHTFGGRTESIIVLAEDLARRNGCAFRYDPDGRGKGQGLGSFCRASSIGADSC